MMERVEVEIENMKSQMRAKTEQIRILSAEIRLLEKLYHSLLHAAEKDRSMPKKTIEEYDSGYPTEPIGGDNPYYRCLHCQRSVPEINGKIDGHLETCEWRQMKELEARQTEGIKA